MRAWAFMLGGLLVWTAHFFGLYAVASVLPGTDLARVLTGLLTLAGLGADGYLLWWAGRAMKAPRADEVRRWQALTAALSAAISLVAVLWQGFPVVLA